jgi:hypothetical protein
MIDGAIAGLYGMPALTLEGAYVVIRRVEIDPIRQGAMLKKIREGHPLSPN